MSRIRDALDLDSIPAPSTLCKAFSRLEMAIWRVLLNVSMTDISRRGVTGIDTSGIDRVHASMHYDKYISVRIQQLKTTLLDDTATNAVLDIHITTTRKHDTQIASQVMRRNTEAIDVLVGDKGYDDQSLRSFARNNGVRLLIEHRDSRHSTKYGTLGWILTSTISGTRTKR